MSVPLGDRMKAYERMTVNEMDGYGPDTCIIVRIDGKAFHTFTRHMEKPFDAALSAVMADTMVELVKEVQSCIYGYTQSDEISLVLCKQSAKSEFYMAAKIQKLVSICASLATAHFNDFFFTDFSTDEEGLAMSLAFFDARCFTVPNFTEANNYLRWRIFDAKTNGVNSIAHHMFSPAQLASVNTEGRIKMINDAGGMRVEEFPSWTQFGYGYRKDLNKLEIPRFVLERNMIEEIMTAVRESDV